MLKQVSLVKNKHIVQNYDENDLPFSEAALINSHSPFGKIFFQYFYEW